jgi:hypothetical protein
MMVYNTELLFFFWTLSIVRYFALYFLEYQTVNIVQNGNFEY